MKQIFLFAFAVIGASIVLTSCNKENQPPADNTKTFVLPAMGDAVVDANNAFAFNILHAACLQDNTNSNKLISPLSIYLALSMVYNGANSATKDSIAHALQLAGIDMDDLNAVCNALITQLPGEDNRVQLAIANSIWYNQSGYQPLPSFLTTVQDSYVATMQSLDFSNGSSVNTINKWVADNTNNRIPTITNELSADDMMYLINAIYFNGAWKARFPTSGTHNDAFHLEGGGTKMVPFMNNKLYAKFYADDQFSMVELPYGGGNSFNMFVMLPKQAQSILTFATQMNETLLANAIGKMDSAEVEITLPKWEYSYSIPDMRPELSMLGMGNAFKEGADFSNMYNATQVKPYITNAAHKTYIKVNEEGTEAAAVTAVGMGTTSSTSSNYFKADHPFLYTIIEKQTGIILFTGIVNAP